MTVWNKSTRAIFDPRKRDELYFHAENAVDCHEKTSEIPLN
jgi:hypothetical protein